MRLRVLGCGSSSGVPMVTGRWGDCDPLNPKNVRTRTSLAIETDDDEVWVIDTGPDLRRQLIREALTRVDGVFLTHAHADHVLGMDELRPIFGQNRKKIPLYGDPDTLVAVTQMFGYLIDTKDNKPKLPIYTPFLEPRLLTPAFEWKDVPVRTFVQDHGGSQSMGYRFGNWAYSTDVKDLSNDALRTLEGTKLWFVDCIAYDPKPTHAHLEQTLAWIERIQPERAILIHMSAFLDYETLKKQLPAHVVPAYDGLQVDAKPYI
jgi:phosphoribosyl 1,2-cyclic phosphate phosphodiesterase